jgi:copper(I)-binding protein
MRKFAAAAALMLASCGTSVDPDIAVEAAWARATLPGQMSSAAYFTITNKGGEDELMSVSSPAGDASLHSTSMESGVMKMRPLPGLAIPASATVTLAPGGTHVMLMGLKQPLAAGSSIQLDLNFRKSGERRVEATVKAAGSEGEGM